MEQDTANTLYCKELIVVEGKNDAHAVRRALGNVDIIWTEGFGLTREKLEYISEIAKRQGVIVCTDPDFVGKQIREKIRKRVPEAKHVYLSRESARCEKTGDIGLENVTSEEIRKAFSKILEDQNVNKLSADQENLFNMSELINYGLVGTEGAAEKRKALGKILGIGDTNAKQFLYRLNRYSFKKEELQSALRILEGREL